MLLFLIPADSVDHKKSLIFLANELKEYNPDMLQKDFIIAISKSDLLDDELKTAITKELSKDIPACIYFFCYSKRIEYSKRSLWQTLNKRQ